MPTQVMNDTQMSAIEFELKHLQEIDAPSPMKEVLSELGWTFAPQTIASCSGVVSLMVQDKVVAIIGSLELWPGVCEIWSIISQDISEYRMSFCRWAKKLLTALEKEKRYHRIQLRAIDDAVHTNFCLWLGFTYEGTMKMYGPDKQNYIIWAKVF
jgi:hypothetical protein